MRMLTRSDRHHRATPVRHAGAKRTRSNHFQVPFISSGFRGLAAGQHSLSNTIAESPSSAACHWHLVVRRSRSIHGQLCGWERWDCPGNLLSCVSRSVHGRLCLADQSESQGGYSTFSHIFYSTDIRNTHIRCRVSVSRTTTWSLALRGDRRGVSWHIWELGRVYSVFTIDLLSISYSPCIWRELSRT